MWTDQLPEFLLARELYLFSAGCYISRAEMALCFENPPSTGATLPSIETTQKLLRASGDPCFGYAPTRDCNIADLLIDYAYHTKCADIRDKIMAFSVCTIVEAHWEAMLAL